MSHTARNLRHPADPRPADRLRHHYEVERALADRLRQAGSRAERAAIYATMYDTLFAQVPDHPRLRLRETPHEVVRRNARKLGLVARFLSPDARVLEIGSGDCTFAYELARRARVVCGAEISAKGAQPEDAPANFALTLYDGFELPFAGRSFQLAFSDQLIEHLHPDDAEHHFRAVAQALAPGGAYVFRTPHRFTGPHDVSGYFTNGPAQGFHLKEWTYRELADTLRRCGYGRIAAIWSARGLSIRLPIGLVAAVEGLFERLPSGWRRPLARRVVPDIVVAARTRA